MHNASFVIINYTPVIATAASICQEFKSNGLCSLIVHRLLDITCIENAMHQADPNFFQNISMLLQKLALFLAAMNGIFWFPNLKSFLIERKICPVAFALRLPHSRSMHIAFD